MFVGPSLLFIKDFLDLIFAMYFIIQLQLQEVQDVQGVALKTLGVAYKTLGGVAFRALGVPLRALRVALKMLKQMVIQLLVVYFQQFYFYYFFFLFFSILFKYMALVLFASFQLYNANHFYHIQNIQDQQLVRNNYMQKYQHLNSFELFFDKLKLK